MTDGVVAGIGGVVPLGSGDDGLPTDIIVIVLDEVDDRVTIVEGEPVSNGTAVDMVAETPIGVDVVVLSQGSS